LAARFGSEAVVKLLLENGAEVYSRDKQGYTALHVAILDGKKHILELLLKDGADINSRDEQGDTALYMEVRIGNWGIDSVASREWGRNKLENN
jgi:ankyrin repeat protein